MNIALGSPVPSIIWDSLQNVLQANTLRLAKEVAETLGVSHIPLMTELNAQKVRPYVVEIDDTRDCDMLCDYVCQRPDAPFYMQPCEQPIFWNATSCTRCPQHLYSKPAPKQALMDLEQVTLPSDIEEPLYIAEDGTLYDGQHVAKGVRKANKLLLFEVEDS